MSLNPAMARRIELWPVDKLRPYERNPRTNSDRQVDQIAASIVEFGFTSPILVDGGQGILAGHGRLLAAKKLVLAEVPVVVLDPFAGSGSTLIACEKAGRQARLIELDPKYADVVCHRWRNWNGEAAVLDADGRTFEEIAAGEMPAA